ncbi:MAG TPA: alpha-galactosidase [Armatimonadota bacterium]|jgi:alpha-galactosidase
MRNRPVRIISTACLLLFCGAAYPATAGHAGEADAAAQFRGWYEAAWLGQMPTPRVQPGLLVRRQDYATLQRNKSVMDTPLQIGETKYARGLGTHAVSEIVVQLPRPAREFSAFVGIDNNYDTQGRRGSAVFTVEANGKELYRSGLCRGGEAPVAVKLDLQEAPTLVLRVADGGDGPGWDQSDWTEARVVLNNGTELFLDELPIIHEGTGLQQSLPFSFTYGGKPSRELLPGWRRTLQPAAAAPGREGHTLTYTDPASGLEVRAEVTRFTDFPAAEWVLYFTNTGPVDTPILERILPLDMGIAAPEGEITLHHANGSTCSATDFLPRDEVVKPSSRLELAPNGGRSSDGALPFYNLEWNGGGLAGAIGWSGQWALTLQRNGEQQLTLQAGQQTTHLKLHPGESLRTPRILVVSWQGDDRMLGHNLLRQVLLAHYVPRENGEPALPPVTMNTWFMFDQGNAATERNQTELLSPMAGLGVEGYWLDAGWFEGGWPAGAGSWVPKAAAFPHGLKPLGEAAHQLKMKFVLWFEPERVTANSRVAKEHPEWVMHTAADGDWGALYKLGDPAARAWLTDYLSQCITDWGIDIYRNDFNIDPLRFWQADDAPDRQGMAEIRYIEGLYTMWDELRQRHPGLLIDNCASGGRRLDLETMTRSFPLWQSDTQCCGKAMPEQDQVQNAGLSLYVPLHAAGVWSADPYQFRSVMTTGGSLCSGLFLQDQAAMAATRSMIAEAKALRPYYLGDYYPLLEISADPRHWCAWQYHRHDLGQGFIMCFRREGSPYAGVDLQLHGLEATAKYRLTNRDDHTTQTLTGAELAQRWAVQIPTAPGSVLFTYEKL